MYSLRDTTSLADSLGLLDALSVAVGVGRDLDGLAELADVHGLPAADADHLVEELTGGAGGVHVGGDVGVEGGALLEDADAVVVAAHLVVRVVQGLGNCLVGVDEDVGLFMLVPVLCNSLHS